MQNVGLYGQVSLLPLHRILHECSCTSIIKFIKFVAGGGGGAIRCEALPNILSISPNEFNKFSNIMQEHERKILFIIRH